MADLVGTSQVVNKIIDAVSKSFSVFLSFVKSIKYILLAACLAYITYIYDLLEEREFLLNMIWAFVIYSVAFFIRKQERKFSNYIFFYMLGLILTNTIIPFIQWNFFETNIAVKIWYFNNLIFIDFFGETILYSALIIISYCQLMNKELPTYSVVIPLSYIFFFIQSNYFNPEIYSLTVEESSTSLIMNLLKGNGFFQFLQLSVSLFFTAFYFLYNSNSPKPFSPKKYLIMCLLMFTIIVFQINRIADYGQGQDFLRLFIVLMFWLLVTIREEFYSEWFRKKTIYITTIITCLIFLFLETILGQARLYLTIQFIVFCILIGFTIKNINKVKFISDKRMEAK